MAVAGELYGSYGPPRDSWTGAKYVTWVGVSRLVIILCAATLLTIFSIQSCLSVRQFTRDPILIADLA